MIWGFEVGRGGWGKLCAYLWKNLGYARAGKYSHSNGLPLASWDS